MKKRILAMLLSALLAANISACNYIPKNDVDTDMKETDPSDSQNDNGKLEVSFETYDSIISTYRKIVELCPRYEEVKEDDYFMFPNEAARSLYSQIFYSTLSLYPRNFDGINGNCYGQFGYTVKDLNGDGVDELILRREDHHIIAVFTMVDETPVLLDSYYNRKSCWIDPDGYLHVHGSNGADKSVSQIYRISDQTGELILLEEWGTDGHNEASGMTFFYRLVDNTKNYITKEEYSNQIQSLPYAKFEEAKNISEYMHFSSLFGEEHPSPEPYVPPVKG